MLKRKYAYDIKVNLIKENSCASMRR